jgi:hypothetical protein
MMKKSEKGLLTEYQQSFSFWKKSSVPGRCFTDPVPVPEPATLLLFLSGPT